MEIINNPTAIIITALRICRPISRISYSSGKSRPTQTSDTIISAAKGLDKEEKDENDGKYIRKERYSGAMSRSFYVGDELKQEDIKAKYQDGILKLSVPKKEQKKVETTKHIAIEG